MRRAESDQAWVGSMRGKSSHSLFSLQKRSISEVFTASLIAMVVLVSIFAAILIYFNASQQAKEQLTGKANEYCSSLARILEIPLWNSDKESLKKIGEAYEQHELVSKLVIADNAGHVYVKYKRDSSAPAVDLKQSVLHDSKQVGTVEIALTSQYYQEINGKLLWSGIVTVGSILLVLAVANGFLLRLVLSKPLMELGQVVNAYASGKYASVKKETPFIEFQPLMAVLDEMGNTITSQMVALQDAEKKYRSIYENAPAGIFQVAMDGRILNANPAMAGIFGTSSLEELQTVMSGIESQLYPLQEQRDALWAQLNDRGIIHNHEVQLFKQNRERVWISSNIRLLRDNAGNPLHLEGFVVDITERKRLEEQLRQAAKMEAVGNLVGGVAHDFNNLMTAVIGYGDILLSHLQPNHPQRAAVEAIKRAGETAAVLTHRLLAFSRKQIVQPVVLDLNAVVADTEKMLHRMLREDIELIVRSDAGLNHIVTDPGQIEQVIINLAVNARDAMPSGGKLIIETANTFLDEAYCRNHVNVLPGSYVMLAVSDTGCGMDAETLSHIFEPFFTTKARGKGTGLGLATIYGIVKQSYGHIWAYSEPGKGSTFKIYFPASDLETSEAPVPPERKELPRGEGTIMVAEDNTAVRELAEAILKEQGYTVLSADCGQTCLRQLGEYKEPVDLLLTDVVMPDMNGKVLFQQVKERFPNLKVIFMSGYTDNVIVRHNVLEEGVNFIQKPFTVQALLAKVQKVLDVREANVETQ